MKISSYKSHYFQFLKVQLLEHFLSLIEMKCQIAVKMFSRISKSYNLRINWTFTIRLIIDFEHSIFLQLDSVLEGFFLTSYLRIYKLTWMFFSTKKNKRKMFGSNVNYFTKMFFSIFLGFLHKFVNLTSQVAVILDSIR